MPAVYKVSRLAPTERCWRAAAETTRFCCGTFDVFRDEQNILPVEDWRVRLESLISHADTFVFCLTPHSLTSEVCRWEINVATRLGKPIVPVVLRDSRDAAIPPAIAKLNFIFLRDGDEFDAGVDRLRFALQADIAWIREHTRIGELARQWDRDGRRTGDLLRGPALEFAERWIAMQPPQAPSRTGSSPPAVSPLHADNGAESPDR